MSERPARVWIDADAAPREAKEVVFRAARRLKFETILVANQSSPLPLNAPTVRAITVSHGANVADKFILDESEIGDIVVTADIPMAALLVAKGVYVIDPRGEEYTPDNIQGRESVRNFMDDLRGAGMVVGRNRPYDARNKKEFAAAFDRILTRAIRQNKS